MKKVVNLVSKEEAIKSIQTGRMCPYWFNDFIDDINIWMASNKDKTVISNNRVSWYRGALEIYQAGLKGKQRADKSHADILTDIAEKAHTAVIQSGVDNEEIETQLHKIHTALNDRLRQWAELSSVLDYDKFKYYREIKKIYIDGCSELQG